MRNAVHVLLVLAALAILAYPAGLALDAAYGSDVYLLSSVNDTSTVEANRELFSYTADPARDYGPGGFALSWQTSF